MTIGVIADTHGLLRAEAVAALRDCACLVHAGDVGTPAVLAGLRTLSPRVVAVCGNVDAKWRHGLPERAEFDIAGRRVLVVHDLKALGLDPRASGIDVVVSGHSHQPRIDRRDGVLYVNPGSAGPRRFRLPVTVARIHVSPTTCEATLVMLMADVPGAVARPRDS